MTLSESDAKLFYELWFPLLDYVNDKRHVNKKIGKIHGARHSDPGQVKEIANVLWTHTSDIDEYLRCRKDDLSDDHKCIIAGWKKAITDKFFLERHLKKGSIFIDYNDNVYQVKGIITSWEEMFWFRPLPILLDVTLIPFRDVIISDGLVIEAPVVFGRNYASELKDVYMSAKRNGTIIRSL